MADMKHTIRRDKEYSQIMHRYLALNIDSKIINAIDPNDHQIINELLSLGYLDFRSFPLIPLGNAADILKYNGKYPLTKEGKDYLEMGWYLKFKQSGKYQLLRDSFAFMGGIAAIVIGILQVKNAL